MNITEEQKESIIKEISNSYTAESLGKLAKILGGKQTILDMLLPTGNLVLRDIMARALGIAFERVDRQIDGGDILKDSGL